MTDLTENDQLEVDYDSSYESDVQSGSTSVTSAIYRGYVENGRRYQTTREGPGQYFVPSDERQFDSMEAAHLVHLILESQQKNPLFRSPIKDGAHNILDIGTGSGAWCLDVADRFPNARVRGIDLYPPPQKWVPPNCHLEVEDMTKDWTWNHRFDFIHMRYLIGSCSHAEWDKLYKRAYDNLEPGGWIEQVEVDIPMLCDDGSLPSDSLIANYHNIMLGCAEKSGNPCDMYSSMRSRIASAGFINIHERDTKLPIGSWPKHKLYQDAGRCSLIQIKEGLEGWSLWLLTHFGAPKPWTMEEATVYAAKLKVEFEKGWHVYQISKRVWAQKPLEDVKV